MKIGFLGNTNNYPFRLARTLRALGHDIVFFVDRPRSEPRHRPEYHYADVPYPYPAWIQEIAPSNPLQIALYPWALRSVIGRLQTCDGVILNGLALSVGERISRPIIGLLTGSDLDVFANLKQVSSLAAASYQGDWLSRIGPFKGAAVLLKHKVFSLFVQKQRAGIAKCCLVEYALPGLIPEGDALLDEIGIHQTRRTSFMMSDIEHLPLTQERTGDLLRIFCAARLQWRKPQVGAKVSPLDLKGTDIMLEGLKKFVVQYESSVQIHLIAFGSDAELAERYIKDIGLAPYVWWHPQLSQEQFLAEMVKADVVLENFGPDSCIGMAGRDAIALGKPVIAWGKSAIFERELGEPLPIYEARTADEICSGLKHIVANPAEVAQLSTRARAYASRWFSARRAADRCGATFEEALKGTPKR